MKIKSLICALSLATFTLSAFTKDEAIEVKNAWARATVPGQQATGAFMTLTAAQGAKLVGVASAVGVAQVHEMKMEGGVMKMNQVKGGLSLPAGKAVELKPGGYHVMLMDLKAPLVKDSTVPLTLIFMDDRGLESRLVLKVLVAASAPHAAQEKQATMDHSMHGTPAK